MGSIEERLRVIEGMVAEIHAALVMGREPPPPGIEEYKRAVEAMVDGDMAPLRIYLQRGGVVPKAGTVFSDAAAQRGGTSRRMHTRISEAPSLQGGVCNGSPAGSANLPTAANNPVTLPDTADKERRRVVGQP